MTSEVRRAIEAVWRIESARVVAGLTRMVRDLGLAEELAQDALVAALEHWPTEGVPDNPGAWLMTTAKRRAIDRLRRARMVDEKHRTMDEPKVSEIDLDALDEPVSDDLLRLVFISCHPVLSMEARVALTLRLLGGLTTEEIARAFLTAEPTIAQRIVRAKRTLSEAKAEFEVPRGAELAERLGSVMQVIYLVFNEGYAATAGDDWMRPALIEDALRLGRMVAELVPDEPEVHGLVALMEIQASRARARVDAAGNPILLLDQNRTTWDHLLIRRGLAALERAGASRTPYVLQASIAACHARAVRAEDTDWARIASLYAELHEITPSPVIELNRAVAVAMADGAAAGLAIIDGLRDEPALAGYHLLPGVRGDLLTRLGRHDEARVEFERAAALTKNAREKQLLLQRALSLAPPADRR